MLASIFHRLEYLYEQEVNLGPQRLYLYPRQDKFCEVQTWNLQIHPQPNKLSEHVDAEGNFQQIAFFHHPSRLLIVEMVATVQVEPYNPFDFYFIPKESQKLPMNYHLEHRKVLSPYLSNETLAPEIVNLSNTLQSNVNGFTSAFLMQVNQFIFSKIEYELREQGNANDPLYTLREKKGSCRDFAVLFASICRAQGFATRFVSGYYIGSSPLNAPDQSHNLHAWVEVFLPGGGWRGFDPTQNEVVCGNHIALASSFDLSQIPPVSGYFNGNGASKLTTIVDLRRE